LPDAAAIASRALIGLVPFAHVADVQRSIDFYQQLGFRLGDTLEVKEVLQWAWLANGHAHLTVARSARPMNPQAQDVLFYLYSPDVVAYHAELKAKQLKVSSLTYPEYMKAGEFRIEDPDGYTLLVGQWDEPTL
jgi:catechol 2,3-dioxygenase-like lactoylglutathione lyase family enzyme